MLQIPDTSKIPFLATFYKFPSQNNLDPAQLTAQNLLFSNCYSNAALPDPDQCRLVCYAPPLEAQVHGVAGPPALFVRRRLVIYFFFLFKIFPRRSNSLELERSENFFVRIWHFKSEHQKFVCPHTMENSALNSS